MIDWLRVRNNVVNTIFCITMAVFLVVIASVAVYQIDLQLTFGSFDVGFSKSELTKEYLHLINYLLNPGIHELKFLYFAASPSGIQHFADVKALLLLDIAILIITAISKYVLKIKLFFYKSDAMTLGMIPIVIGLLVAVNFEQFFVLFHKALFNNDDWLFNPLTDPIINVLPEFFFEQLIVLFLVIFELLILVGYLNKKRAKSL